MRLLLLFIMEHEVITCCTICMKFIVLCSVLLDQFLVFLVYSIKFYVHDIIIIFREDQGIFNLL